MDQTLLYSAIRSVGYTVLRFEDHPQFFGNWALDVQRGTRTYQVIADRREGWLIFFRDRQGGGWEKVAEVDSHSFSEEQEVEKCVEWLAAEIEK